MSARRVLLLPVDGERAHRFAGRIALLGLVSGLVVGLSTSATLAADRILLGSSGAAIVASIAPSAAALVAFLPIHRRFVVAFRTVDGSGRTLFERRLAARAVWIPQLAGAIVGVALVHVAISRELLSPFPWLCERPQQWVNDAAGVGGLLAIAWAAGNVDLTLLIATFFAMACYRATSTMWHLDGGRFAISVQDLVPMQVVAGALALGWFRSALVRRVA